MELETDGGISSGTFDPSWTRAHGYDHLKPVGRYVRAGSTVYVSVRMELGRDPIRTTAHVGRPIREIDGPAR